MKLTKATIGRIVLPHGKTDHIIFDQDDPGFGLRLRAGGKRTWIVQYRVGAKQRRVTLGTVNSLDPDKARKAARDRLAQVTLGGDPQGKKIADRAKAHLTVGAVLEDYRTFRATEVERGRLRQRSHEETERYLRHHWRPLHELRIDAVTRQDVASRLGKIRTGNGETAAIRARSALSGVFAWAVAEGYVEANPVIGTNKPDEPEARDRVLSDAELSQIWAACRDDDYGRIVRLLMLTGARRDEIGGLAWSEVDIDGATINLPGERTKNGRPHAVPLSPLAVAVLETVAQRERRDLVFGDGKAGFSGWSAAKDRLDGRIAEARSAAAGKPHKVTEKVEPISPWRLHDLRRTCATVMADRLGVQPHIVEAVLNHVGHKSGVAGIYNRATYQREVAAALALWADRVRVIVEGGERKVMILHGAA